MYTADGTNRPPHRIHSRRYVMLRLICHWQRTFAALVHQPFGCAGLFLTLGPGSILWTPVCLPSMRACLCCGARLCKSRAFCRQPVSRPFLWTFYLPVMHTADSCLLSGFQGTGPAGEESSHWRSGLCMPYMYCTCILGKKQQLTRCILRGFAPCRVQFKNSGSCTDRLALRLHTQHCFGHRFGGRIEQNLLRRRQVVPEPRQVSELLLLGRGVKEVVGRCPQRL